MFRTGKIARLPKELRQELNTRLSNGEAGESLVVWLNGLPEVQAIMNAEFEGMPIREQNISEWRKGGYLDALNADDAVDVVERLRGGAAEWKEDEAEANADLGAAMEHYLSSRQALESERAADLEGEEKWELWDRMCLEVLRLRQAEMQAEKLKLAEERLTWKQEAETLRLEERAVEFTAREKHRARAAAARRGEFTEEEEEEAIAECDAIYHGESEEEAAYYKKLRWDTEDADALACGEPLPDHDYEIVWTSWPEQPYPESYYGPGSPYRYHKTQECIDRERQARQQAARRGERGPKPKPFWSPTGFAKDGRPVEDWEWPAPEGDTPETAPEPSRATSTEAAVAGGQPARPQPRLRLCLCLCPKCRRRRPRRRNRGRGTFSPAGLTRPATPRVI